MGVTGTWTIVGAHGSLADEHGERRAVALGEAGAAGSFGALSVPLVVAAGETTGLGWRLAPAVGIALGGLLAWRIRSSGLREPLGELDRDARGSLPARGRVALFLVFAVVCAEWSVAFWGATFADDQVGLSAAAAVALSSAFFAAMLTGRLVVSVIARRVSAERVLAGALLLALLGFPVLWSAESAVTAGAGLLLVGLGIACLFPLAAAITIAGAPGRTTPCDRSRLHRRLGGRAHRPAHPGPGRRAQRPALRLRPGPALPRPRGRRACDAHPDPAGRRRVFSVSVARAHTWVTSGL